MAGVGPAGGWLLGEQAQSLPPPPMASHRQSPGFHGQGRTQLSRHFHAFSVFITVLPPNARDVAKQIRPTQSLVRNTFALFIPLRKFE